MDDLEKIIKTQALLFKITLLCSDEGESWESWPASILAGRILDMIKETVKEF